jgi:formylglycine-generating enzyme required for sulfatase activity
LRLPTESEWEYACRAGTDTPTYGELEDIAWFERNITKTRWNPIGRKAPNAFGLHDMLGNAGEWCEDWYDPLEYGRRDRDAKDPRGPATGSGRVVRGGAWFMPPSSCRASARRVSAPDQNAQELARLLARLGEVGDPSDLWVGFRLAKTASVAGSSPR